MIPATGYTMLSQSAADNGLIAYNAPPEWNSSYAVQSLFGTNSRLLVPNNWIVEDSGEECYNYP
jgi:hypothetical protein